MVLSGSLADFADLFSSSGTLNVFINDNSTIAFTHVDAFIAGTAGADSIVVNVLNEFNFSTINWNAWTAGTDTITYNGSANNNLLIGSGQRETFNGGAGNDTLSGIGGIDTFNGGSGNDLIALSTANDGSFVDGGADTDTLRVSGTGTLTVASLANIEAVNIQSGGILFISAAQFANGLAVNSALSGTGTILVSMTPGDVVFATAMTTGVGADITLAVSGSTGVDVIKSALGVTLNVGGGDSSDQIRGGNLADTIDGNNGNDKIMGLGGADQLTGGAGADQFRYLFATDAGTGANADQILDFTAASDKMDFRVLDANPNVAGRQALNYIGTAAFANNGSAQVRWTDLGADLRVEVDLDGNGSADMQMLLVGAGAQTLTATDFLL
jgi:Ca2+-binding RTX toxin-like protein